MGKILMQSGAGTPTDDATATAADMVVGASAYVDDELIEGSMVERDAEQPTTGVTVQDNLVHVGMLPGAYRKNGRFGTPEIKASLDTVAQAAGVDGSKMLQGYNVLGRAGQIPVINTMGNGDGRGNHSQWFGLDGNNHTFWVELPHRAAYYTRHDGKPHVTIEAAALGNAIKEQVLQGARFSCAYGINVEGTIPTWYASGDIGGGQKVIDAFQDTAFIGDYGAKGRGIYMRVLGGTYVEPGVMWCFAPCNTALAQNVREGVPMFGMIGTMKDYAASCVPFDNAHFDGTHLSGWATGTLSGNALHIGDGVVPFVPKEDGNTSKDHFEWWWAFTPSVDLTPFREIRITVRTEAVNSTERWWQDTRVYLARINGSPHNRSASPVREKTSGAKGVSTITIPISDLSRQVFIAVKIAVGGLRRRADRAQGSFLAKVERIELIA